MYGPVGFLGLPVAISSLSPEMMGPVLLPRCSAELPPPSCSPGSSGWALSGDLSWLDTSQLGLVRGALKLAAAFLCEKAGGGKKTYWHIYYSPAAGKGEEQRI